MHAQCAVYSHHSHLLAYSISRRQHRQSQSVPNSEGTGRHLPLLWAQMGKCSSWELGELSGWQSNDRVKTGIHHTKLLLIAIRPAMCKRQCQKNMVGQCGPRVSQQKLAAGKRAQAAPFHHKKKNDFMQTHVDLLTNLFLLYDLYAVQGCSDIKLQHSGRSQHGWSCLFIVHGGTSQATAMSQAPHWPTGRNSDGVAFPPGKSRGARLKKANQSKTTTLG